MKTLCSVIFEISKKKKKKHTNYSVCQITEGLLFLQYKGGGAKVREKEECKRGNKHLESISAARG